MHNMSEELRIEKNLFSSSALTNIHIRYIKENKPSQNHFIPYGTALCTYSLLVGPLKKLQAIAEWIIYIEAVCALEPLIFLDFNSVFN